MLQTVPSNLYVSAFRWLASSAEADASAAARVHAAALAAICTLASHPYETLSPDVFGARVDRDVLEQTDPAVSRLVQSFYRHQDERVGGPQTEAITDFDSLARTLLLGKQAARDGLHLIERASGHGLLDLDLLAEVGALLQGYALHSARNNDVIYAARFTRAALGCLGPSTEFRIMMTRYLKGLQVEDGGFLTIYDLAEGCRTKPDLSFIIRCVVATQAVWTLAECRDQSFRGMRAAAAF